MVRFLANMILALALLVSPLAMVGGGMASAHAMPAMDSPAAHCAEEGRAPSGHEEQPGMAADCAIACAALPAAASRASEPLPPMQLAPAIIHHLRLSGLQPERETPPPRTRPEI
jgi:hypothetical protein